MLLVQMPPPRGSKTCSGISERGEKCMLLGMLHLAFRLGGSNNLQFILIRAFEAPAGSFPPRHVKNMALNEEEILSWKTHGQRTGFSHVGSVKNSAGRSMAPHILMIQHVHFTNTVSAGGLQNTPDTVNGTVCSQHAPDILFSPPPIPPRPLGTVFAASTAGFSNISPRRPRRNLPVLRGRRRQQLPLQRFRGFRRVPDFMHRRR